MSIRDDAQTEARRRFRPSNRPAIPTEIAAEMAFEAGAEWAAYRPATDEEVEAAAAALAAWDGADWASKPWDGTIPRLAYRRAARAALEAARSVRAGQ